MGSNTRSIYAEIRIDWEDYEDVMDELALEDAIESVKDGVDIYVVPNYSTIIREHQLMKEALEEMRQAFFEPGTVNEFWLRKHINDTLKQITL